MILNHYPHNTNYFTEGFLWHQGHIYESTGLYGHSRLVEYELKTGRVIKTIRLPKKYFGEGLTLLNGKLYQLTYKAETGFIYSAKPLKKTGEFHYQGQGWGLTNNGKQFIMSNGSNQLFFRNPTTFAIEKAITVHLNGKTINNLNELEFIHHEIYANVWNKDMIFVISPTTGKVLQTIPIKSLDHHPFYHPQHVANGIAYNGNLLITGKMWPYIYEIELKRVNR